LLCSLPAWVAIDAFLIEPAWIKIRRCRLAQSPGRHRLVHFTDLHYRGNRAQLMSLVKTVNGLQPSFVCFTGDIAEEKRLISEAAEIMSAVEAPLYGVPGNHDHWENADFAHVTRCFAATGGAWLMNAQVTTADRQFLIAGCSGVKPPSFDLRGEARKILLLHYPHQITSLSRYRFDLVLAGHSHGGQVRLPFLGALIKPHEVGPYEVGWFETPSGPMYVNPGIGWFSMRVRFLCRPEITVITI
jgi:uncharacterized protein